MKSIVSLSMLTAVSVSAFVPLTNTGINRGLGLQFPRTTNTTPFTMMSTTTLSAKKNSKTIPIPNPFKVLPWNAKKEAEREARKLKTEASNLHRQLGIAQDATYEEITQVTSDLISKYEAEGDIKGKIKVEIAKDKILQIRLNERLAGLTTLTEDAKAQSRLEEIDEDEDDELYPDKVKSREWRVPRFMEGLIQKPDVAYRNRQIKVFGLMTLVCFVLPPMTEKIIMINWLFAAGQIGRRGMPGAGGDGEFSPYAGKRSAPHQRTAILLSMMVWLVLKVWTGTLGNIKGIFGPRYVIVVEAALMNLALGIFTAFTQTYKAK